MTSNLKYYNQILKETKDKSQILKYLPLRSIGIKYQFSKDVFIRADGLIMNCGKDMENCLVSCSLFEPEVKKEIDKLNGGIFIDVGSHIGKWSIYASKKADRVFSIEPTRATFILQKQNIETNQAWNVKQYNDLVLDEKREVKFYQSRKNPATNSIIEIHYDCRITIKKAIPLDSLIKERKNIKLIKIDVEGLELRVIQGAKEIIDSCKPNIIFESNEKSHLKSLINYFKNINYVVENLDGSNNYLAIYQDKGIK